MQERLKPAAALSLVGYAVGLPLTFLVLLVKHRASIVADQALRVAGQGSTEATNPYFHIRMQFQELYRCVCTPSLFVRVCGFWVLAVCRRKPPPPPTPLLDGTVRRSPAVPPLWCTHPHPQPFLPSLFRPELYWWRLVLVLRKFCIVGVALMFSSTPLFQAWCVGLPLGSHSMP